MEIIVTHFLELDRVRAELFRGGKLRDTYKCESYELDAIICRVGLYISERTYEEKVILTYRDNDDDEV